MCQALLSRPALDVEAHALAALKEADHFKEIAGAGISGGAEHAHQAFGWSDRGIDVVLLALLDTAAEQYDPA
jgi:hypothetical protein